MWTVVDLLESSCVCVQSLFTCLSPGTAQAQPGELLPDGPEPEDNQVCAGKLSLSLLCLAVRLEGAELCGCLCSFLNKSVSTVM